MCFELICRADRMTGVSLVSGRQVDSRVELLDGWDACLVAVCILFSALDQVQGVSV
jgi:hypothetical protein